MITIGIKKDMSAVNRGKINSKDFFIKSANCIDKFVILAYNNIR